MMLQCICFRGSSKYLARRVRFEILAIYYTQVEFTSKCSPVRKRFGIVFGEKLRVCSIVHETTVCLTSTVLTDLSDTTV